MVAYANRLHRGFSIKTFKGYTTSSHHLKDYLKMKNDSLLFPDITIEFLNSVEKHLFGFENKFFVILSGVHMWHIRTVYNQAISKKQLIQSYTRLVGKYIPPSTKKSKKALPLETIEKIYNYVSDFPEVACAEDMWLFAYFANGRNVKDIAFLKYENINDGVLTFIRKNQTFNKGQLSKNTSLSYGRPFRNNK